MRLYFLPVILFISSWVQGGEYRLGTGELMANFSILPGGVVLHDMDTVDGLGGEWGNIEDDGTRTFRWVLSDEVSIPVPETSQPFTSLMINLRTTEELQHRGQSIDIVRNGRSLKTVPCPTAWTKIHVGLPSLSGGRILLRFSRRTKSGSTGGDTRTLAAAIDYIRMASGSQESLAESPVIRPFLIPGPDSSGRHFLLPTGEGVAGPLSLPEAGKLSVQSSGTVLIQLEGREPIRADSHTFTLTPNDRGIRQLHLKNDGPETIELILEMTGHTPDRPLSIPTVIIVVSGLKETDLFSLDRLRTLPFVRKIPEDVSLEFSGHLPLLKRDSAVSSSPAFRQLEASGIHPVWIHTFDPPEWDLETPDLWILDPGSCRDPRFLPEDGRKTVFYINNRGPFSLSPDDHLLIPYQLHPGENRILLTRTDPTGTASEFTLDSVTLSGESADFRLGDGWRDRGAGPAMNNRATLILLSDQPASRMVFLSIKGHEWIRADSQDAICSRRMHALDTWIGRVIDEHERIKKPVHLTVMLKLKQREGAFLFSTDPHHPEDPRRLPSYLLRYVSPSLE